MNRLKGNGKELKSYNATGTLRVIGVLFRYPEKEFTLSELASEANVAKQNIKKIANLLSLSKLIEFERWGKRIWRIKARQREWKFLRAKISYNMQMIYESSLVEVLEQIFDRPRVIILFGSFRYGEDVSSSDIDLAIETSLIKEYAIMGISELKKESLVTKEAYEQLENIERNLGRKLQIHLFNRAELYKQEFRNNVFHSIVNGIVLYGFLEIPNETRKNSKAP